MAGIFGFGSSLPAPMTMTVTNTPAADLALTNFAYCSASDLRNFSGSGSGSALSFALVGDSLVLSLRYPFFFFRLFISFHFFVHVVFSFHFSFVTSFRNCLFKFGIPYCVETIWFELSFLMHSKENVACLCVI